MARIPAPQPDEVTQAWWNATAEKQLKIQECRFCGHVQHYPRPFCLSCENDDLDLVEVSGEGKVHSFTVVHRSAYDELPAPYVIALVDLEEGVRLLTRLMECDIGSLECDLAVSVRWIKSPGENAYYLPVFVPKAERFGRG